MEEGLPAVGCTPVAAVEQGLAAAAGWAVEAWAEEKLAEEGLVEADWAGVDSEGLGSPLAEAWWAPAEALPLCAEGSKSSFTP